MINYNILLRYSSSLDINLIYKMGFFRDWVLGKVLDRLIDAAASVAQSTSERIREESRRLQNEGHSRQCADATALDQYNYLDGNLITVIRACGGCQKCGI
jgi:hypothetical protein